MPAFKYKVALHNGRSRKGLIDATNRSQAVRKLREDGLFPIEVVQVRSDSGQAKGRSAWKEWLTFRPGVKRDAVVASVRQLATLLRAGLPLDKALATIIKGGGRQTELQRILSEIRESIREGADLAGAFAQYPRVFNETFVTMVRAGENSGTLGLVMERLADHMEQQLALKRKIQASLAYPLFTLLVGCLVVVFLLAFVVPKVTEIFVGMDKALPTPTVILIAISDVMAKGWLFFLIAGGLLVFGLYRYRKTPRGKVVFDALLLKVPVLKEVLSLLDVSRFSETLGMLLVNGATLMTSLEIVRNVVSNTATKQVVDQIRQDVQEGKPLTGPMETSGVFEHTSIQMIAAGEQSGRLDEMLLVVAKDCDNRINAKLQVLTALMEPVMILVLGGMVGFVVMAVLLPIFEMSSLVSG